MVRRLNTDGWKALPVVAVAIGALLWHVLACTESPMAFAPNGDLAFTTLEPYETERMAERGMHVYRLMLLPAGAEAPRVLEESSDWMISAPGFSPDGQKLAYLRVPLLTDDELEKLESALEPGFEALKQATSRPAEATWGGIDPSALPGGSAEVAEASQEDRTLPPTEALEGFYQGRPLSPPVPAQLVERRSSDGQVVSVTALELPLMPRDKDATGNAVLFCYLIARPQYSPDGQWVYFCPCGWGIAVNPSTRTQRLVSAGPSATALSPDGKTLAELHPDCLGFIRTDGSMTSYVRCETDVSRAGMVWADNETLAILRTDKVDDKDVRILSFVRTDGSVSKTVTLPEMDVGDEVDDTGQLALSPRGEGIVVAFRDATCFLDSTGKLLGTVEGSEEKGFLTQPTFTPDGSQVAFKYMEDAKGQWRRAAAIVFFSPDGRELRRVGIPPAHEPTAPPAEAEVLVPEPTVTTPETETPPTLTPGMTTEPKPDVILELPPLTNEAEAATQPALAPEQEEALEELVPLVP